MLLDKIPGLLRAEARAKAKEEEIRRRAFLPCYLRICRIDVRALTPRHYILLDGIRSPFIQDGEVTTNHIAAFLWIVSTKFLLPSHQVSLSEVERARTAFTHYWGPRVKALQAVKQIRAYVDEAFFDAPPANGETSSYASYGAHLVERFELPHATLDSRGQPIPEGGSLDLPFAQLFQRLRVKDAKANPRYNPPNPLSDSVVRDYVRKAVERQKRQTLKRQQARGKS
jgi:hypothetical protein